MKSFVMATVRHTGSLFMMSVFLNAGYQRLSLRGEPDDASVVFDHLYTTHMDHFRRWLSLYPTLVIPLRNPVDCARGWAKRQEGFDRFFEMWENLFSLSVYEPFYIPIDTKDRDQHLQRFSDHIGVSFSTNWEPVNTSHSSPGEIPDISTLYQHPLIQHYYGEQP